MMTSDWYIANERCLSESYRWVEQRLRCAIDTDTDSTIAWAELRQESALAKLARTFDLDRFEQQFLMLCAGWEFSPAIRKLCEQITGRPQVSFELALTVLENPSWDVVSPTSTLNHWRMISVQRGRGEALAGSLVQIDARILNYLKGVEHPDERLLPCLRPIPTTQHDELADSQTRVCDQIADSIRNPLVNGTTGQVELVSSDADLCERHAVTVFGQLQRQAWRLDAATSLDPEGVDEWKTILARECRLSRMGLLVDLTQLCGDKQDQIRELVTEVDSPVLLVVQESTAAADFSFSIKRPKPGEQVTEWLVCLPTSIRDSAKALGTQFSLTRQQIRQIASEVKTSDAKDTDHAAERVWDACRCRSQPRLSRLAQKIDATATWDQLVLPDDERHVLQQIASQVRQRAQVLHDWGFVERLNRGMGTSVLFAGESGTGKTMAAEVLANDLRLDLYRIDLSSVVSKYIGETEKNLRRLFDAAEEGGAILFFDEADALFGKRSQVKDSHDRYANIQINYLLQRLETFRGLSILATNLRSSLDQAFLRRLRYVVTFPVPETHHRKAIWKRAFPARTPTDRLNFDRLARLHLTGGNIFNIALNAAFAAAEEGPAVSMRHVLTAAKAECVKLKRPINQADFHWAETEVPA